MKIFLSYSWKHKEKVDLIDNLIRDYNNTEVIRDVRDLKILEDVSLFMDRIAECDKAILFISDSYLKSKNCMYEVLKLLDEKDYRKKLIPIIISDAKIKDAKTRIKYFTYWGNEINELNLLIKNEVDSVKFINGIIRELEHFDKIRNRLDEFLDFILSILYFSYDALLESNFNELTDTLGLKTKKDSNQEIFKRTSTIIDFVFGNKSKNLHPVLDVYRLLLNISYNKDLEISSLLGHLQSITDNVVEYFTTNKSKEYSVSIKLITEGDSEGEVALMSLIRDSISAEKRSATDNIKERIYNNSAYSSILRTLNKKNTFFVNNDLSDSNSYISNSKWNLSYLSTMIAPIFRETEDKSLEFVGFFCVDSTKKNAFDIEVDKQIIVDIAKQLFLPIKKLRETEQKASTQHTI